MKYDRKKNLFDISPRQLGQLDGDQNELQKLFSELDQEEIEKLEKVLAAIPMLNQLLGDVGSSSSVVTLVLRVSHSEYTPDGEVYYEGEAHLNLKHVFKAIKEWKDGNLFTLKSWLEIW